MDAEQGPLSSEQTGILESFAAYLRGARYSRQRERLKIAEACLQALGIGGKSVDCSIIADYQQGLPAGQSDYLWAFRRYLVRQGWLVERKVEVVEGRVALLPEPTADWLRQYVRHMKRQNLARGTVGRRVWVIVRWLRRCSLEQQADLTLIDRECIEMLIEQAQDVGNGAGTINTQLSDLHHFFLFLSREGLLTGSPILSRHWLREPESLPRALAPEEVTRLLGVVKEVQDRAIFLLLLRTGMRGGELVGLQVEDVDLERRTLHIRHGTAKMAKSRVVYFSEDAAVALQEWLKERGEAPTERLFFCWPHLSLTRGTVNWRFQRYLRLAKITRHYTAHSLRHTFATELLNAGVSLVTVQELLGHEWIGTTQIYARLSGVVKQAEYVAAMAKIERRQPLAMVVKIGGRGDVSST